MQIPTRPIALGLLIAFGAMPVRADAKTAPVQAPAPVVPVAAPPLAPIDLTIHPVTTLSPAPFDLRVLPATPAQSPPADSLDSASDEVKRVARWVIDTGDNGGTPFVLVDKVNAQVFAFSPAGQLQGKAPVLLGMTHGDKLLAPNDAPMTAMSPLVRITPAGRFVSRLAIDSHGTELLVLNYDASISLHPVVKGTPEEHRAERLASPTSEDNRISYGCINVPPAFYSTIVSPAFAHTKGIVYVLPENSPASELFGFGQAPPAALPNATASNASNASAAPTAHAVPAANAK